jgi:hypothetical protein
VVLRQDVDQKGGSEVKYRYNIFLLAFLIVVVFFSRSLASVEWDVQRTLRLEKPPIDVAVSGNGTWIFVLTEQRNILIYSADGALRDKIPVEKDVDGIYAGPREDVLFLTSRKNKTVQYVTLDFIQDIDVSGSPFKGARDAPVAIVVFNDYQ